MGRYATPPSPHALNLIARQDDIRKRPIVHHNGPMAQETVPPIASKMLVILAVPARFQRLSEAAYRFKTAPKRKTSPESENPIPDPPPPGGPLQVTGHYPRPPGLSTLAPHLQYRLLTSTTSR